MIYMGVPKKCGKQEKGLEIISFRQTARFGGRNEIGSQSAAYCDGPSGI